MRILHVLSALEPQAASAVTRLTSDQRHDGHVVAAASMPAFGDAPGRGDGLAQFVDRILGGADSFDIIHAHGTAAVPVTLALEPSRTGRTPVIVTLHDWLGEEGVRAAQPHAMALNLANLVTAPNALTASLVTTLGVDPHRVRVIPYPVDTTPALSTEEQALERELITWRMRGGDVLCAIGYGPKLTHHEMVLKAITYVAQGDALMCVLAGESDVNACLRHAESLGIGDRVRVCGHQMSPRAIAARCDYLALPSFDERRPFALVEAWCDGVPVMAGRNAAFAGMDSNAHGTVFFDATDALDLARAIATVRSTTTAARRLLVERARSEYRRFFMPKVVYDAYMAEYRTQIGYAAAARATQTSSEENAS